MKVLVTGVQGLLGGVLASALADIGHEVVATGRRAGFSNDKISVYHAAELANDEDVAALFERHKPDAIVHAAARLRAQDQTDFVRDNVLAATNLAKFGSSVGTGPCILFSTISVYSGDGPFLEDSPTLAQDSYGRTKREAEKIWVRRLNERAIVFRLAGLHGWPRYDGFVYNVIARLRQGLPINLAEPDTCVTLTFIHDVIVCTKLVLGSPRSPASGIFNLATRETPSYREIAEALCGMFEYKNSIVVPPEPRRRNRVMDTSRIREKLKPQFLSLADHLRIVANAVESKVDCA